MQLTDARTIIYSDRPRFGRGPYGYGYRYDNPIDDIAGGVGNAIGGAIGGTGDFFRAGTEGFDRGLDGY